MTKTLKQLEAQNQRLRDQLKSKVKLKELEEERVKLGQQNKRLLKQLKKSPTNKAITRELKNVGRGSLIAGKMVGRGLFKAGKKIGSGLIRYGRFLNEQEIRNQNRARSLKKASRSSPRRKTKSRRR